MRLPDLRVRRSGEDQPRYRPATIADLVAALREEGAEETAWCEPHHSVWLNDDDGCEAALAAQVKPWREPCREGRRLVVPIPALGVEAFQ